MRWVTYLSPSGGQRRVGVLDDGCVFGAAEERSLVRLLADGADAAAAAHRRALADPVEIIVEFEARLCAPLIPEVPVVSRDADAARVTVAPEAVRGTDEGVAVPDGARGLVADVGAARLRHAASGHAASALACLWRVPDGRPYALTLGPAAVTDDELAGAAPAVTASLRDVPVAEAVLAEDAFAWARDSDGALVCALPARTRVLEPGEELFVDGGPLGAFELRVGSQT